MVVLVTCKYELSPLFVMYQGYGNILYMCVLHEWTDYLSYLNKYTGEF